MKPIVFPVFLPNQGVDISKPEQFLQNAYSPYSRNLEFFNERLRGRGGLLKFDNAQLSGPVMAIDQYWKFTGSYELIVCTTKDIYRYDFSNTRYVILTPLYNTGTIEVQAGSPTIVRGTGTSWSSSNVKPGDFIRLSGGSDHHTGQTWYEVLSLDAGTQQITLTSAAATTSSGTSYALRQTFSGTNKDLWDFTQFLDENEGEVWLATNGVDTPIWYNGTGQAQLFPTLPTGFTTAKYIRIFYDRVVFLWTREGGQNQPIRVRWSAVADFKTYNDLHFLDLNLPSAAYWIKGAYLQGNTMVIPKEGKAYLMNHVGGDQVFDVDYASNFAGSFAAFSTLQLDTGAFYFGYDNRFRFYNLLRDETPFDDIFDYLLALDPTNSEMIYGYQVEGRKQLRWALPYNSTDDISPMIVYDYGRNIIEIWEYVHGSWIRCIGEYLEVEDLYVDDVAWAELYVDEEDGYWDDRTFLANSPVILYGCEDGYVRKADLGTDDDGIAYDRIFRTKRIDFGAPQINKRLWKQQWWFEAKTAGGVSVKIRRNDSVSYEAGTKTISLIQTQKDKVKAFITWDKEFENAEFEISAQVQFELLGFLNWFFPKRKTHA